MKNPRPILLVEDDHVDAMTVKRAMNDNNINTPLHIVFNGEDALEYLKNPQIENPLIILLDLNMPKMDGFEFLEIIKQNNSFKRIPVVILTSSREEQDKSKCFEMGVSGYILKPIEYKEFVEILKTINIYWKISEKPD